MSIVSYAGQCFSAPGFSDCVDPAAQAFIASLSPEAGTPVSPGKCVFLDETFWKNRTDAVILVPDDTTAAGLTDAGLYEMSKWEQGVQNVELDEDSLVLTVTYLHPDVDPIEIDLKLLGIWEDDVKDYEDLGPNNFVEGKLTICRKALDDDHPKGIYKGTGDDAILILGDSVNEYTFKWNAEKFLIEVYRNDEISQEFAPPYTDFKMGEGFNTWDDVHDPDRTANTIIFINTSTEDHPRGIYYIGEEGSDPVLKMPLLEDAVEVAGVFGTYEDMIDDGNPSNERVLSILTESEDMAPAGIYIGDGNLPVLAHEFHEKSYRGSIKVYADAEDTHKVEGTITFITIGTELKPRGIYEGTGSGMELVLSLPEPYRIKTWTNDSLDCFIAGDLFVMKDLETLNTLRLFQVPSSWISDVDSTGSEWNLAEQKKYDALSKDEQSPIGKYVVSGTLTAPYSTPASAGYWSVDFTANELLFSLEDEWVIFPKSNIAHGAILKVLDPSIIDDSVTPPEDPEFYEKEWVWNKVAGKWLELAPEHPEEHLRLHSLASLADLKGLTEVEPFTTAWVKDIKQQYTYFKDEYDESYEGVIVPDDEVGVWIPNLLLDHYPLLLQPVENLAALVGIDYPVDGNVVRVTETNDRYEFFLGAAVNVDAEFTEYADEDSTGVWRVFDKPSNHPHLRLPPVESLVELAKLTGVEDNSTTRVSDQPVVDGEGWTHDFTFYLGVDFTGTYNAVKADDASGWWLRERNISKVGLSYHINVDATALEVKEQTIIVDNKTALLTLIKVSPDTIINVVATDVPVTVQAEGSTQFDNGVSTSDDGQLVINQKYKQVKLVGAEDGTDTWLVIT